MANLVDFDEQSAGGSSCCVAESAAMTTSSTETPNGCFNNVEKAVVSSSSSSPSLKTATNTTSTSTTNCNATETPGQVPGGCGGHGDGVHIIVADGNSGSSIDAAAGGTLSNALQPDACGGSSNNNTGVPVLNHFPIESGQSSHHSMSNNSSMAAATSEESLPRRSFSCFNSSPEFEESDNETELDNLMRIEEEFEKVSVGVQTEYDEDFPPLIFLRSMMDEGSLATMPLLFNMADQPQFQQLPSYPLVSIVPSSASSSDLTATCSNSADGTLQLVIQNFRHMSDTVRGPSKYVQGVPWRIMVMPRQHVVQKKGTQKCLGFFLQCCPDAYSESWSCQASAELRLISQKPGVPNFTRKTNHVYTAKENDWGYSCFMTWADILDESQGYIRDDKVILEVSVKADPPKNILSHKEFQKKIQDYKRLADMQCQRGLIDKAIECNLQALKFCKDKDSQCKIELEAQKAHLIEMKLKQSIERIEKGNDASKVNEDDTAANLSALRHALGTNAARTASTKTTQTQKTKSTKENDNASLTKTNNGSVNNTVRSNTPTSLPTTPRNEMAGADNNGSVDVDEQNGPNALDDQPDSVEKTDEKNMSAQLADNDMSATTDSSSEPSSVTAAAVAPLCNGEDNCANCMARLNNKALIASGNFNKMLFNFHGSIDYVKEKFADEEGFLTDQIQNYLRHMSLKEKDSSKNLAELELLASPLDAEKKADQFLDDFLKLGDKESDILTIAAISRENDECKGGEEKRVHKKAYRRNLCDSCLKEEHIGDGDLTVKNEKRSVTVTTSESGCQTDFSRCLTREATDAAARIMQLHAQQQLQQHQQFQQQLLPQQSLSQAHQLMAPQQLPTAQQQQLSQQPALNLNTDMVNAPVPIVLPTRQRKKATAKKTMQQQAAAAAQQQQAQQNHQLQQQQQQQEEQQLHQQIQQHHQQLQQQLQEEQQQQQLQQHLHQQQQQYGQMTQQQQLLHHQHQEEQLHHQQQLQMQQQMQQQQQQLQQQYNQQQQLLQQLEETEKMTRADLEAAKENEARLLKHCAELQKTLQASNERNEKLCQQLKDRKTEIKKLEKKAKSEAQLASENTELHEKLDVLKKEVSHLQRQLNEEQLKYKRDTQSLSDSKRHLQTELNGRMSEIQKLTNQLEEKSQALKRSESQLANERKSNSITISNLNDRVRKAEINLLEHKLEDGSRVLERARDDCVMQIRSLEEQLKRHFFSAEQEVIKRNIKEWENKKTEVIQLIAQAKTDFTAHINSIKNGKQLSQLPKIQVPKPPPCPKLHPMPAPPLPQQQTVGGCAAATNRSSPTLPSNASSLQHQHQQQMTANYNNNNNNVNTNSTAGGGVPPSPLPLERKAITPPSNRSRVGGASASGGATTPQHHLHHQQQQQQLPTATSTVPPLSSFNNFISSGGPTSMSNATVNAMSMSNSKPSGMPQQSSLNQFHHHQPLTSSSMMSNGGAGVGSTIAPIGVRPQNYQNGVAATAVHQQQKSMLQQQQQQQFHAAAAAHQHHHQGLSHQPSPALVRQSPIMPPSQQFTIAGMMQPTSQQHQQQSMSNALQQQYLQQQQQQKTLGGSIGGGGAGAATGSYTSWSGWGANHLNNELFGHGRSFGPLGSEFGGNASQRANSTNPSSVNISSSTGGNVNNNNESNNVFFS